MTAHRLKADPRVMYECKSLTSDAGSTACQSLIQSKRRFTAIVAANDLLALGCYAALDAAGLKCPADVSVTGYNDMPFTETSAGHLRPAASRRSEEHTSELQSRVDLVCRLLLEKKQVRKH